MNTDDQFDQLFGKGAKSIRRDAEFSAPTDADGIRARFSMLNWRGCSAAV
jgi:hypothetical protein